MQVYIDEKAIDRKAKIGKSLSFTGLGIMIVSLVFASREPDHINTIFILAMIGLFSSQIGIGMVNRWTRRPRVDEILTASVKGMDSNYHLFHYMLGADHVLITPGGVHPLIPALEDGRIIHEKDGKWFSLKKRGKKLRKRKIKDLSALIQRETASAEKKLKAILTEPDSLKLIPIVVFLHNNAELNVDDAPVHCVHQKKIKPFLRKLPREVTLAEEDLTLLIEKFSRK
jgi:hypothetical protein